MKTIGLLIALFGLLTAIYSVAQVVPKYTKVNREWTSSSSSSTYGASSYGQSAKANVESKRHELRDRSQTYALAAAACALIGLVLAAIGRKKQGGVPFAAVVASSALTALLVVYMQVEGNIF